VGLTYIIEGKPKRRARGRIDYLLRIRVNISTQPIAVALLEAKKNTEPPDKGLEQAKRYARLNNVPFVYSSNGYLFVEYDSFTGKTSACSISRRRGSKALLSGCRHPGSA